MAILKLHVGREHAISGTIAGVALDATGKFGTQYRVDFTNGDSVYLNKDPFERQVQRLNKLPNELEGETVTIWKKPMPDDPTGTKGYLNVDIGGAGNAVAARARTEDAAKRDLTRAGVAFAPRSSVTYDDLKTQYTECLGDAIALLRDTEAVLEVAFTPSDFMAAAATLFIQRQKAGV